MSPYFFTILGLTLLTLAGCGVKGAPTPYVEAYPEKTPEAVAVQVSPTPSPSPSPLAVKKSEAETNKAPKKLPKGKQKKQ